MKIISKPVLAGLLLASLGGAAIAQTTPATRACMAGEQMIGGVCQPLTRSGNQPNNNIDNRNNNAGVGSSVPNTTGSTGSGGNQNTGASGNQGGTNSGAGGSSTGNQNTGGSGGQGGSSSGGSSSGGSSGGSGGSGGSGSGG